MSPADTLRITEIFLSLQGETSRTGLPTVFVRLTGCPLRCGYCDSAYAFHGGESLPLAHILAQVAEYGIPRVCITGGEPLAQKAVLVLMQSLCDAGYAVSIETSGHLPIEAVDRRVARVLDLKTPGSGEASKNRLENLADLRPGDEVKFVLCDRADYDWAKALLAEHRLVERCPVLFSPVWETLQPQALAAWVLADRLPVRMQVQLHKILWGSQPGV